MPAEFSVIVPMFNAATFIAETVHSVLDQTDGDFELILVDDGSTDRTAAIVASIEDPRIRMFSIPASGRPAIPRNFGIQHSRGRWISFLDAHDRWPRNKLARFREEICRNPGTGLFFSNGWVQRGDGRRLQSILPTRGVPATTAPGSEGLLLLNYIPLSSVVVSREVLTENPFNTRRDLRAVEDYSQWLALNRRTAFRYIPEPLLFKRMHEGNISADRAVQLERLHTLLDDVAEAGMYPAGLIALARTLYDARYRPCARTRVAAVIEIAAAFVEHPIRTSRRMSGVLRLARSPRILEPAAAQRLVAPEQGIGYGNLRT